jgi:hypothetical protein
MAGFYYAYHLFLDKSTINGDVSHPKIAKHREVWQAGFFGHLQRK